jgi:hypothetical protein
MATIPRQDLRASGSQHGWEECAREMAAGARWRSQWVLVPRPAYQGEISGRK